ncbi:LysR substrate-binding domain-containing protein [Pseudoroseomonas cervicalis]|uniref:LysR substrate-binding domain-containing protein n=1 Tax=Teichococcus cervicalis TaxID=204525 RepID=UPI0022F16AFE|nr:LysR substrate-binding domain-containing protein [Pseudoroseomonas cervicalis]WBV44721.1 LysR substrate-binding domain-containing protein [Pseudoroseomonas cervicalis]
MPVPPSTLAGLSLRDLEYAVTVAEMRHFGRAAERCGVSQPALSEQIRKLEALLGVALFERAARRVEVTPQGEALLAQARAVTRAARGLLDLAQQQAEPLSGPLRLGVIATLGPYYLPGVLRAVRDRFPRLVLRLQEGRTAALVAALEQGELDAALIALPAPTDSLAAAPLFFEPFLLACPQGHALLDQPALTLADLRGSDLLLLEEGHCLRDQALSLCAMPRGERDGRFATSLEMLRHMIAAGEGISLLPQLAAQGRSDLGGLVALRRLEDAEAGRRIGLVWRGTDPRRESFRALAGFLRETAPLPPAVEPAA